MLSSIAVCGSRSEEWPYSTCKPRLTHWPFMNYSIDMIIAQQVLLVLGPGPPGQTLHVYQKFHLLVFTCIFTFSSMYILVSTFIIPCTYLYLNGW